MIEAPQVTFAERVQPARAVMIVMETSGIGAAVAARLAAQGDLVLLGGRGVGEAERFAARLRDRGDSAFAARLDLADPRSVIRFLAAAHYLIGTPDVLITDVGLAEPSHADAEGACVGAQTLAARVIPAMVSRGTGDVVLVSPELGGPQCPTAGRKLDAWFEALDAEFVGTGVRASVVRSPRPGAVTVAEDVGRLVAGLVTGPRLRLVELLPPVVPAG